jgi:dimethylaniline monooxygenase (N-oxide forming)
MTSTRDGSPGPNGHSPEGARQKHPAGGWKPRPRVCVIGAGLAGLVTAKVMKLDGFRVTVFEREPEPGGVWSSSRSYPGLRANTPREAYAFSDYPYPADADDFPTAAQVRSYLNAYVDHFGLRPLLNLSTEVQSVSRVGGPEDGTGSFEVTFTPSDSDSSRSRRCDFVVGCSGTFSRPHVPHFPGQERFEGTVCHSSEFLGPERAEGKRVVVVGGGKSALGCAASLAPRARKLTLVCRRPHWMVPRYFPGGMRMDRLFLTRFAELLLPPYHRPGPRRDSGSGSGGWPRPPGGLLRWMTTPLLRLWWAAQTRLIPRLVGMPASLVPESVLPEGLERSGVGTEFFREVREGHAHVERTEVECFIGDDTLRLESGRTLKADLVILATGWRQGFPFLDDDVRSQVLRNGRVNLFRQILPPEEPRLGFIGFASSAACALTSEVAAHWLSQRFRGELELPDPKVMEREIERVGRWLSARFPGRPEGTFIGPYVAHYVDELMDDMGLRTRRKGNPFREYLGPFWPDRYRTLGDERRWARSNENVGGEDPGGA